MVLACAAAALLGLVVSIPFTAANAEVATQVTLSLGDTVDEGMNTIQLAGTDWNDAVRAYNTRRAQIKGEIVAQVSKYFGFELPVTFPYYQGASAGQPVQNPLATQVP